MDNLKRFFVIFVYVLFICYLVFIGEIYLMHLDEQFKMNFPPSVLYPFYFQLLFPILVGMCIALPQFVVQARKAGSWRFDWIFFLAVGIPAFYILLTQVFAYTAMGNHWPLHSYILFYNKFRTIIGLVWGFALLAAFCKKPPVIQHEKILD